MKKKLATLLVGFVLVSACSPAAPTTQNNIGNEAMRIISLDYCADQFVLKLADRKNIAALSPDAEASFSYMRKEAKGLKKTRPRAEDVLLLKPDIVVRSYGGGPNAAAFFERAGIKVVQIGFANDLKSVEQVIIDAAKGLGVPERGGLLISEMKARLAAISKPTESKSILYMTSKGAVAGQHTLIDDLLQHAGFENFQATPGWGTLPLEKLVYKGPDTIAAGFFETSDLVSDIWTPSRHPVARRRLDETAIINLPGAWTSCGGWFLLDAVEALSAGAKTQ